MGHVVNYAYRLYEQEDWIEQFARSHSPTRRSTARCRSVALRHPPAGVLRAEGHPDEDWAETFAVWLTPGVNWQDDYANRPVALPSYSLPRTMPALAERDPVLPAATTWRTTS